MKTSYTLILSAIICVWAFVSCQPSSKDTESTELNSADYIDSTHVDSILVADSTSTVEKPVHIITDSTAIVTILDRFREKNKTVQTPYGTCYYTDSLFLSDDSISVLFTLVESTSPEDSVHYHEYSGEGLKVLIVKKTIKDNKQVIDTITVSRTTFADTLFRMGANEQEIKTLFINEIKNFAIKNDTIIVNVLIMQMDTDVWNDLIEVKLWDGGHSFKDVTPPEPESEW